MQTCMSQRNINSTAYKILTITQFTFFLLVTVMFNKEFSLKLKNFSSLRRKFFDLIL